MEKTLKVDVVNAEESLFSGNAEFVALPGIEGELGILPGHTPLITLIRPGLVRIRKSAQDEEEIFVAGGVLEIQPFHVIVLADVAIRSKDLDEAKAKEAMEKAKNKGVKLILPVDTKVGKEFKPDTESKTVAWTEIPADWEGFDIGEKTIEIFSEEIRKAKTVVWNGPVGLFEFDQFAIGTNAIAKVLSEIDATTIIGGGDSP